MENGINEKVQVEIHDTASSVIEKIKSTIEKLKQRGVQKSNQGKIAG